MKSNLILSFLSLSINLISFQTAVWLKSVEWKQREREKRIELSFVLISSRRQQLNPVFIQSIPSNLVSFASFLLGLLSFSLMFVFLQPIPPPKPLWLKTNNQTWKQSAHKHKLATVNKVDEINTVLLLLYT